MPNLGASWLHFLTVAVMTTVWAERAESPPPSPPYSQPERKISGFLTTPVLNSQQLSDGTDLMKNGTI